MAQEHHTSVPAGPARAPTSNDAEASGRELDRLPPPAFPPGTRKAARSRDSVTRPGSDAAGFPEEALISPDEPIRRIGDGLPDGAIISPDDPIPPGSLDAAARGTWEGSAEDTEYEVEVTGIGEAQPDPYHTSREPRDVDGVASVLERVAAQLRDRGPSELLNVPATTHFESSIRGFVAGYLLDEAP